MTTPDTIELKNIDPDDISDVMVKIEKSFGFKFGKEVQDVKTFGQLCDVIVEKVPGRMANDCTSQQALYKLRNAIANTLSVHPKAITPVTDLHDIFPRAQRRKNIARLEKEIGFKLNLLQPKEWIGKLAWLVCCFQ